MRPRSRLRSLLLLWLLALLPCSGPGGPAAAALRDDYRQFLFAGRQVADLNPRLESSRTVRGIRVERVRITTEAGQEAVALVMRPSRPRRYPTVLVQHFLGGSKDDPTIVSLLSGFALRGYLAAAIDGRYRGERGREVDLVQAIDRSLVTGQGHPWLIDTVFDVLRTVDYLQSRADVDVTRIGMTGISEGGIETWMAAAADERIRVAVPALGVTRFDCIETAALAPAAQAFADGFDAALLNFAHQLGESEVNERVFREAWARMLPGFSGGPFEATNLVPLIAPRPLLVLNHGKDELIPLPCAQAVVDGARRRYAELAAGNRIRLRVAPNLRHAAFDPGEIVALYGWFDRWLKK
jgi:dienelactone hydrolase